MVSDVVLQLPSENFFQQAYLRAKSCGKDGQRTPLEIASRFPLSHSFNNNKLDDPDHFLENPSASVASLRPLIGSTPEQ